MNGYVIRNLGREIRSTKPLVDSQIEELRQLEAAEPGDDLFVRWTYSRDTSGLAEQLNRYWIEGQG